MRNTKESNPLILKKKSRKDILPQLGTEKANELIEKIVSSFKDNIDYGLIPGCKKPSMYKPGAEKVCLAFNLDAMMEKDNEVLDMFGKIPNLIALKCILVNRSTKERIGEGRGSAILGSTYACKTPNSTVKMAEKSAHIDAALRVFALSERFTQDVEDMERSLKKANVSVDGSKPEDPVVQL